MILIIFILYLIYLRDFWSVSINLCTNVCVYMCTHCMPPGGTRWGIVWVRICRKYCKKGIFSYVFSRKQNHAEHPESETSFFRLIFIDCIHLAEKKCGQAFCIMRRNKSFVRLSQRCNNIWQIALMCVSWLRILF